MSRSINQRLKKLEQRMLVDQEELILNDGFQVVSESGVVLMENRKPGAPSDKKLRQIPVREWLDVAERLSDAIGEDFNYPEKLPETQKEYECVAQSNFLM